MSHKDLWVKIKRESKGRTPREELHLLEEYLSDWPEFKGPYQELRKKLERRVVELRKIERVRAAHPTTARVGSEDPFSVKKRGLAEVAIIGLPNVGKSSVFAYLTGTDAEVADYPYTTLTPNVGMFTPGGFEFEMVDLPPFPEGSLSEVNYAAGLREAVINADLACVVLDLSGDWELQLETMGEHVRSMGLTPPGAPGRCDGARPLGALLVATHADEAYPEEVEALRREVSGIEVLTFPSPASARRGFAEALCRLTDHIVVDARDPISKEEPLAYALPKGATALDLAAQIHKELAARAEKARIWGPSARFGGQEVGLDHVLLPGDTVEIVTR
jgi:ribosome-interacting GTPase 1